MSLNLLKPKTSAVFSENITDKGSIKNGNIYHFWTFNDQRRIRQSISKESNVEVILKTVPKNCTEKQVRFILKRTPPPMTFG